MRLLRLAERYRDPNPERSHITGLEHALRVAGLACDADPRDGYDLTFVGLVHDLARPLNEIYHGEVMAEIVRDVVCDEAYQILRTHGEYQALLMRNAELPRGDESWRPLAKLFAELEMCSFSQVYAGPQLSLVEASATLKHYLNHASPVVPDASVSSYPKATASE